MGRCGSSLSVYSRLLIASSCLLVYAASQGILYLDENAQCSEVVTDVCRKLRDCGGALEGIQSRRYPRICSFRGIEPIVCCKNEKATTTTTTAPLPADHKGVGEVCEGGPQRWYCRHHEDCPGVREEIQKGWSPKICSFYKREPVICCPPWAAVTTPRPTTTTTWSPNWPSWTRPQEQQQTRPQSTTGQTRPQTYPWQTRPTTSSWQNRPQTNNWNRPAETTSKSPPRETRPVWVDSRPTVTESTGQLEPAVSKAEQMCKKYGQYVYKKIKSPTLSLSEPDRVEAFCGRVITPLIVRGEDAKPREFPHMARIGYGEPPNIKWLCGGSLISENFVLSAAHCTKPQGQLATWVNLGDLDTSTMKDDAQPVDIKIIERFDHPGYRSGKSLYNDIALYKLEKNAPLGIYIRPICLNTHNELRETTALASGWGHTFWRDPGGGSPMLQKVELKLVSNRQCNESYRANIPRDLPNGIKAEYMLCAGGHDGKDTCQGDSGGPLQIARREPYCTYSIIGVTSFGKGCGSSTPGVYTNIANYIPWIVDKVWPT